MITIFLDKLTESYKNDDLKGCETNLLFLVLHYNLNIKESNIYDHELKHILFKSNFIRNPIGVKYTIEDFKKTNLILIDTLSRISQINNSEADTQGIFRKDLTIDDRLTNDLIDLAVYTNCLYQMNIINSNRMDESEIGQLPFVEQMMIVLVFFQDQARLMRQSAPEFLDREFITGMELSVSNRPVEHHENLEGSISDNIESSLEAMNEIVHYLYFQHGKNLKTRVTDADIDFEKIYPYENTEFKRYMYIAAQRHLLCRVEEGIRYGYYELGDQGKTEEGLQYYLFSLENDEKFKARRLGLLRRQYQFQSHALLRNR